MITGGARTGGGRPLTELASPVVQVVTSGTDWPAVVAAITGGVVGLAGIFAATRQSGKSIRAEDARAKLAERRRIYANYLATLTQYAGADNRLRAAEDGSKEHEEALRERSQAQTAARTAVQEVTLIAPASLSILAQQVDSQGRNVRDEAGGDRITKAYAEMIIAMRADLGEPLE